MPQHGKFMRVRGPDVEVISTVAWRRMNEAGTGVVSYVIAGQKRNSESHNHPSLLADDHTIVRQSSLH